MIIYFLCLLAMTLLGSVASLFLKKASSTDGIFAILKNVNLYIGGFLYLASAVMNIWMMILSYFILKEKISKKKIVGVLLILIGAVLVSV